METTEYEHGFGAVLSPHDSRDYQAKDYIAMGVRPLSYFPDFAIPVLDQGRVGSCVAHALATLKYCQEHRERKSNIKFSTDFIYHNRLETDWQGSGMVVREALSQLSKCGVCELSELPTNTNYPNKGTSNCVKALMEEAKPQRVKSYVRCNNTDEICEAIYQHGGAILAIQVKTSFNSFYLKTPDNWVMPLPKDTEKFFGYHCVCAIGYNKDGIIIQNSWGKNWGSNGLAVLPWDYPLQEAWAVVDELKQWDIIELPVGGEFALKNGAAVPLDVPAQILNGRTMVPIRFVAEALGADVEWLAAERKVIIRREKE